MTLFFINHSISLVFVLALLSFRQDCGKARWDVKTLTDPEESKINFSPKRVSIFDLLLLPKPDKISNDQPRFNQEFNTYQINCYIREFKVEDDGDYHLVLQQPGDTSKRMVAEIVDPNCPAALKSKHQKEFLTARTSFEACTLKAGKVRYGIYKIIGTGFFDKIHGATGAAINGIELHPVIYFAKFK